MFAYVTVSDWFRLPAPVTVAVQGSSAEPVYVTFVGHVTVVTLAALSIVKYLVSLLPSWFVSPPKVALAEAFRELRLVFSQALLAVIAARVGDDSRGHQS